MFKIIRQNGKFVITEVKATGSQVVECAADDLLTFQGGDIKAIDDDGHIEGYAVVFSDAKSKDLLGDFFTKATNFYFDDKEEFEIPFVLYHHGQNKTIGRRIIGKNAKAIIDDVGVFVKAELNKRDKYEKAILEMVKKKKLGYSTGALPHLVTRKSMEESGEITAWAIAELSLTPVPVEPRTLATTVKSLLEEENGEVEELKSLIVLDDPTPEAKALHHRLTKHILDCEELGVTMDAVVNRVAFKSMSTPEQVTKALNGEVEFTRPQLKGFSEVLGLDYQLMVESLRKPTDVSVKGIFEDALAEEEYKTWELWSTFSKVVTRIVSAAVAAPLAGASDFKWDKLLDEAVSEYAKRLRSVVGKQITEYMETGNTEYRFYLRALDNPRILDMELGASLAVEDHCSLAVSAFKSVDERVLKSHTARTQQGEGRVLSDKYQVEYKSLLDTVSGRVAAGYQLLESLKPKMSTEEVAEVKAQLENEERYANLLQFAMGD
jgi:phage head maturation protease